MPKGGAWSNSNKNRMLSNVSTVQNQGGGEKKAGLPYQVGRESWVSLFFNSVDPVKGANSKCCSHPKIAKTLVLTKNIVRPVGNDSRIKMR